MNKSRKAINFDLDTQKLKQHYPSKNLWGYKKAYSDIKKFLKEQGFEHRQGSGYVSIRELDTYEASRIAVLLSKNHLG